MKLIGMISYLQSTIKIRIAIGGRLTSKNKNRGLHLRTKIMSSPLSIFPAASFFLHEVLINNNKN